jgi:hypothetical protein
MVNFLDCFQMQKRETAGDADGDCELRVAMGRSFGCEFGQKEDTSMSFGGGETFQCRRGGMGSLGLTRFLEIWAAAIADSGKRFRRPGGFSGTGKGGELERRWRAIYRRGRSSVKAGNKEIDERSNRCRGLVSGEGNGWRLMIIGGSHLSACRREGGDTASGFNPGWAVGSFPCWAEKVPLGLLFFSLFLSLFFFWFSLILS